MSCHIRYSAGSGSVYTTRRDEPYAPHKFACQQAVGCSLHNTAVFRAGGWCSNPPITGPCTPPLLSMGSYFPLSAPIINTVCRPSWTARSSTAGCLSANIWGGVFHFEMPGVRLAWGWLHPQSHIPPASGRYSRAAGTKLAKSSVGIMAVIILIILYVPFEYILGKQNLQWGRNICRNKANCLVRWWLREREGEGRE